MPYKNATDQASYAKSHYEANKQVYKERARAHRKALINRLRPVLRALKENTPCADCHKSYAYWIMQFDHRPGTDKKFEIAKTGKWSSEKVLMDEVAKCDIVCGNCHATRTYARQMGVYLVDLEKYEKFLRGEGEHPGYLGFDNDEEFV